MKAILITMNNYRKRIQKIFDELFGEAKWYRGFFCWKQIKQDTSKAKNVFCANRDIIEKNLLMLEDDESKRIYKGMIKYRITRKEKDFPGTEDDQYFASGVFDKLSANHTFIDCGGFDGNTTLDFIQRANGNYDSIVIFEPDQGLQDKLHHNLNGYHDITIVKKGVWDKESKLFFNTLSNGSSSVVESLDNGANDNNLDSVEVVAIDDVLECRNATFIKMDLEGSEWNALHGASKTIQKNRPMLAICIYHSDEDMVRLQQYIHELVPEYRFYIRQHACGTSETVLYAKI